LGERRDALGGLCGIKICFSPPPPPPPPPPFIMTGGSRWGPDCKPGLTEAYRDSELTENDSAMGSM